LLFVAASAGATIGTITSAVANVVNVKSLVANNLLMLLSSPVRTTYAAYNFFRGYCVRTGSEAGGLRL